MESISVIRDFVTWKDRLCQPLDKPTKMAYLYSAISSPISAILSYIAMHWEYQIQQISF